MSQSLAVLLLVACVLVAPALSADGCKGLPRGCVCLGARLMNCSAWAGAGGTL
jgi:hypothetical protein